ncbi:MAG: methyltransferase domain-containing protein [Acidobacteria bacterium]|nr:methyltransferase domain-containing protein [Acidobacteriota bacterium]
MLKRNYWTKISLILWFVILAGAWAVPAPAFQLGSRESKEWIERLESPDRIAGLKVDEIIQHLGLRPGLVIADIGAGTGVFSRPLAKAVAPNGKVLAVDIDQGLLDYITQRAKQENIANIQPVLGKYDDPNIPDRQFVDLAFFHDVLHHIENRQVYLQNLAKYLMPDGRIVLIELSHSDPQTPHRDQPEMLLSREQVDQWMDGIGFEPTKEFDLFPGKKWFIIYQRRPEPMFHDMDHVM